MGLVQKLMVTLLEHLTQERDALRDSLEAVVRQRDDGRKREDELSARLGEAQVTISDLRDECETYEHRWCGAKDDAANALAARQVTQDQLAAAEKLAHEVSAARDIVAGQRDAFKVSLEAKSKEAVLLCTTIERIQHDHSAAIQILDQGGRRRALEGLNLKLATEDKDPEAGAVGL